LQYLFFFFCFLLLTKTLVIHFATLNDLLTHFSTSISIWCWLLLSTLRYLSIHHPFLYIRIWYLPLRMLSVVVVVGFLTNLCFVLQDKSCIAEDFFSTSVVKQTFLLIEMSWSFCIPSAIIIFADASALWCWIKLTKIEKNSRAYMGDLRRNCSSRSKTVSIRLQIWQKKYIISKRSVWRWLFLALVDVVLNAPENIFRFCTIVGIIDETNSDTLTYYMLRVFSQVNFFTLYHSCSLAPD
uniref:G_PROTEIN_RECEP_F1_2 domain-containing protein n=1 Tax=Enterobius vermicularis TaxID=51028 RepID=A0A0N4V4F5_ENTVE